MTQADTETAPTAERLVFFTDAIAAIALTLLILPLLETVTGAGGAHVTAATGDQIPVTFGRLVRENVGSFGSFVLSFAVAFRLWWSHHRTFEHVETLRPAMVRASVVWAFAIVMLPISTAVIISFPASAGTVGLYGGTLVLANGAMTVLAQSIYRHPEVSAGRPAGTRADVRAHVAVLLVQLLSTLVGAVFYERVNYWAFLLMFLSAPAVHFVKGRGEKAPEA